MAKKLVKRHWFQMQEPVSPMIPPNGIWRYPGEILDVPQAQLDELASKDLLDVTLGDPEGEPEVEKQDVDFFTDEEIASWTAEKAVAELSQNNELLEQVDRVENERSNPRKTVTDAIAALREHQTLNS